MNYKKKIKRLDLTLKHPAYRKFLSVMDDQVRLAIEVSEARARKNGSQQKLAKEAETTQKVISRIESGDTNIGFDLLKRIASCLNIGLQVGKTSFVSGTETTTNLINQNKKDVEIRYVLVPPSQIPQMESSSTILSPTINH